MCHPRNPWQTRPRHPPWFLGRTSTRGCRLCAERGPRASRTFCQALPWQVSRGAQSWPGVPGRGEERGGQEGHLLCAMYELRSGAEGAYTPGDPGRAAGRRSFTLGCVSEAGATCAAALSARRAGPLPSALALPAPPPARRPGRQRHLLMAHALRFWPLEKGITYIWSHPRLAAWRPHRGPEGFLGKAVPWKGFCRRVIWEKLGCFRLIYPRFQPHPRRCPDAVVASESL